MSAGARLIAVVGPSGAGKDTLLSAACAARPALRVARRVVTRAAGAGGEDCEAVSATVFARLQAEGAFALDWRAHGLSYGVRHAALAGGGVVLFNGSRAALPQARARFADLGVIVVTAPEAMLAARLARRGREGAAQIAARLARGAWGLPEGIGAETVINDADVARGAARLLAALDRLQSQGTPS